MAKRFVIFDTKDGFINGTDKYDESSLVFIRETKEIFTQNEMWNEGFEEYKKLLDELKEHFGDKLEEKDLKTINGQSIVGEGDIEIKGEECLLEKGSKDDTIQRKAPQNKTNSEDGVNLGFFTEIDENSLHSFATGYHTEVKNSNYGIAMGRFNDSEINPDSLPLKPEGTPQKYIFMLGNGAVNKKHNAFAITNIGEVFIPDVLSSEEGFSNEQDIPVMSLQKKLKELEENGGGSVDLPLSKGDEELSLRMGDSNANGEYAVALGRNNSASGMGSFAACGSSVQGDFNASFGLNCRAEGERCFACGDETHTYNIGEFACGCKNQSSGSNDGSFGHADRTLFSIGNGHWSVQTEHNAFEVRQNGDIYISDTTGEGEYYEKPMIKLQDALKGTGSGSVDLPIKEAGEDYYNSLIFGDLETNVIEPNDIGKLSPEVKDNPRGCWPHNAFVFGKGLKNTDPNSVVVGQYNRTYSNSTVVDSSNLNYHFCVGIGKSEEDRKNGLIVLPNGKVAIYDTYTDDDRLFYLNDLIEFGYLDLKILNPKRNIINFGKDNELTFDGFDSIAPDTPEYNYGRNMLTFGEGLVNKTRDHVVLGKYNKKIDSEKSNLDNNSPLFTIGCGTSEENRQNALTITHNGEVFVNTLEGAESEMWSVQQLFRNLNYSNWDGETIDLGYNKNLVIGQNHTVSYNQNSICVGSNNDIQGGENRYAFGRSLNVNCNDGFACGFENKQYGNNDVVFSVGVGSFRNGIEVRTDGHVYILDTNMNEMVDLTQKMIDNGWM